MISARAAGYRKAIVKHSLVFPVAYLSLTSSLTLLLVLVGLSGRGDLAADLALIQGATLATFYALSGNTRSLILQRHAELTPGRIFELRLFSCRSCLLRRPRFAPVRACRLRFHR